MRTYPIKLNKPITTGLGIGSDIQITHARVIKTYAGFELWGLVDDAEMHLDTCRTYDEIITKYPVPDSRVETLGFLAGWSGVNRDVLRQAATAGRLKARKSGNQWLSTREAVREYQEKRVPRPRKEPPSE